MISAPHTSSPLALFLLAPLAACGGEDEVRDEQAPATTTVFVDAQAPAGGDGSFARPLRTVREALEVGRPIEVVAIAGGSYEVPPTWDFPAVLAIMPSGAELPTLVAEAGEARIDWGTQAKLLVRDMAFASQVRFGRGEIDLRQIALGGVIGPALELADVTALLVGVAVSGVTETEGQPDTGDGVVARGGSLQWRGGSVTGIADRALVLEGSAAEIEGLTLSSDLRAPLTVSAKSTVTARQLTVEKAQIGVYVDRSSLLLERSKVRKIDGFGLLIAPEAKAVVKNSTFEDCRMGHVAAQGDGAELALEGNSFADASDGACISAAFSLAPFVIRHNELRTCAGNGVSLYGVTDAVVEDNEVHDILPDPMFPEIADGIGLLDAKAHVAHNRVYDTDGIGIALVRAEGEIVDNDVGPTKGAGISLVTEEPGEARVKIAGNSVAKATGVGIIVIGVGAHADVKFNQISATAYNPEDSFGDAVGFGMGADLQVIANTLQDNAHSGVIFLDGAKGAVSSNLATGNKQYGVLELCQGKPNEVIVGENELAGNALGPLKLCGK
ncbi:MAG: right-handed parallel beta-helix repeat-containing protein [Deltaproteobacteria bacterium]|nr:right-handed parallel beta-helix repeat-containing protein [Deltaproteobacteria bacterium]